MDGLMVFIKLEQFFGYFFNCRFDGEKVRFDNYLLIYRSIHDTHHSMNAYELIGLISIWGMRQ